MYILLFSLFYLQIRRSRKALISNTLECDHKLKWLDNSSIHFRFINREDIDRSRRVQLTTRNHCIRESAAARANIEFKHIEFKLE